VDGEKGRSIVVIIIKDNNGDQNAGEDVSSEAGVWLHDMQAGSRGGQVGSGSGPRQRGDPV
jgi:hypothetical protein